MAAPDGFRNAGFICGLQDEARCLRASGIEQRIEISGARTARAVEMAQKLLSAGAESLVSFGLAGGHDPRLGPGSVIVADRVFAWHQPLPNGHDSSILREMAADDGGLQADPELTGQLLGVLGDDSWRGAIVGVNQAVRARAEKLGLFTHTGALACDMESHAVAAVARDAGVPFVVLRVISDPFSRNIPKSALAGVTPEGAISIGAVLASLVVRPWEIIGLLSLAPDARTAFLALRRVARLSTPLFGSVG
ncbi:MAG: hypothetical protein O3A94_01960 [Proteobacteria bacterium]|nr:hypothetical protein [Pseudomonadota bacterium]